MAWPKLDNLARKCTFKALAWPHFIIFELGSKNAGFSLADKDSEILRFATKALFLFCRQVSLNQKLGLGNSPGQTLATPMGKLWFSRSCYGEMEFLDFPSWSLGGKLRCFRATRCRQAKRVKPGYTFYQRPVLSPILWAVGSSHAVNIPSLRLGVIGGKSVSGCTAAGGGLRNPVGAGPIVILDFIPRSTLVSRRCPRLVPPFPSFPRRLSTLQQVKLHLLHTCSKKPKVTCLPRRHSFLAPLPCPPLSSFPFFRLHFSAIDFSAAASL